jgi:hypothetical protein
MLGVDGIYLILKYSRRPSNQRPEQRPNLSCPPPQWLAEPTPTERKEVIAAPSPVVPTTTVPC